MNTSKKMKRLNLKEVSKLIYNKIQGIECNDRQINPKSEFVAFEHTGKWKNAIESSDGEGVGFDTCEDIVSKECLVKFGLKDQNDSSDKSIQSPVIRLGPLEEQKQEDDTRK
jgi:hypothetical protein